MQVQRVYVHGFDEHFIPGVGRRGQPCPVREPELPHHHHHGGVVPQKGIAPSPFLLDSPPPPST